THLCFSGISPLATRSIRNRVHSTHYSRDSMTATASSSKPYECLICGVPIYNTNLGIDACRACTVFYRRHVSSTKLLLCRKGTDDCFVRNTRPLCRKCRFTRFAAVLSKSTLGANGTHLLSHLDSAELDSDSSDSNESKPYTFMDHRSFSLYASCSSDAPFFERMRKAYTLLCLIRNCGEQATYVEDPVGGKKGDGRTFIPITKSNKMGNIAILSSGLLTFFDAVFDDFRMLSDEGKKFFVSRSLKLIMSLDGLYRSAHHFPDEDVISPTYTTYISLDMLQDFVELRFPEKEREYMEKEMKKNFSRSVDALLNTYKRVRPTNEEFLALMGLSLWNNELSRVNEEYSEIVSHNRSAVLSELHKMYKGEGKPDYSMRLGDLLCLLNNIEKTAELTEEDISLMKLVTTFREEVANMKCC
ncbi:hypothetical protein PENTCL1PPCAC_8204, partial [Pristionchus entomophagus]